MTGRHESSEPTTKEHRTLGHMEKDKGGTLGPTPSQNTREEKRGLVREPAGWCPRHPGSEERVTSPSGLAATGGRRRGLESNPKPGVRKRRVLLQRLCLSRTCN